MLLARLFLIAGIKENIDQCRFASFFFNEHLYTVCHISSPVLPLCFSLKKLSFQSPPVVLLHSPLLGLNLASQSISDKHIMFHLGFKIQFLSHHNSIVRRDKTKESALTGAHNPTVHHSAHSCYLLSNPGQNNDAPNDGSPTFTYLSFHYSQGNGILKVLHINYQT